MKSNRKFIAKCLLLVVLFSFLSTTYSYTVQAAGSWLDGMDPGSMGSSVAGAQLKSELDVWDKSMFPYYEATVTINHTADGTTLEVEKKGDKEIGWLDATCGRLFASCGLGLEYLLGMANISISSIMFGKVAGDSDLKIGDSDVEAENLFQFSLDSGNPYGYVGAIIYAILRSIVLFFLAVLVMYQLAKAGVTTTGQDKSLMKEALYSGLILMILLFFIPNIVDLIIYVKYVILVAIDDTMPGGLDMTTAFLVNFVEHSGFLNGFMYLVCVLFMLYIMFMYLGNAIAAATLFAFFPFVAIMSMKDKSLVAGWFKQMFGIIMTPVIDSVILLVPTYLMTKGSTGFIFSLISLIACYFIVPARQAIKQALGLGGSGWGEAAGMGALRFIGNTAAGVGKLAVAAATGGATLAMGAAANAKQANEANQQLDEERQDAANKAAMHDELAKADHGIKNTNMDEETGKMNPHGAAQGANPALAKFENDEDTGKETSNNDNDTVPAPGSATAGPSPADSVGQEERGDENAPQDENETLQSPDGGGAGPSPADNVGQDDEPLTPSSGAEGATGAGASESGESENNGGEGGHIDDQASGSASVEGSNANAELQGEVAELSDRMNASNELGDDNDRMANLETLDRAENAKQENEERIQDLEAQESAIRQKDAEEQREIESNYANALAEIDRKAQNQEGYAGSDEMKHDKATAANDYNRALRDFKSRQGTGEIYNPATGEMEKRTLEQIASDKTQAKNNISDLNNISRNARDRENMYAARDKATGGTGEKYNSANEMAMRQVSNAVMRANANHKNFDSKEMAGVLSNADKARFYRERAASIKKEQTKNNWKAVGQSLSLAGKEQAKFMGQVASFAAGTTAGLATSMMGEDVAMRTAHTVNDVGVGLTAATVDTAAAVGGLAITGASAARRGISNATNPNIQIAEQTAKMEQRQTSAREYANSMRAREASYQSAKQTYASSSGLQRVVAGANVAVAGASIVSGRAGAAMTPAGHYSQAMYTAEKIAEDPYREATNRESRQISNAIHKDEKSMSKIERIENRRDAKGGVYNATLDAKLPTNVKMPTSTGRETRAYRPHDYTSIVSESRDRAKAEAHDYSSRVDHGALDGVDQTAPEFKFAETKAQKQFDNYLEKLKETYKDNPNATKKAKSWAEIPKDKQEEIIAHYLDDNEDDYDFDSLM